MSRRAQTTLDFALGVSLFAAVLLFVFIFVPGLLSPFTVGLNEEAVASNRVVDGLVGGQFGSPAEPGRLDVACTVWFFENAGGGTESSPADCRYDGETTHDRLGLDEHQLVNVTLVGNVTATVSGSSILCWDDGADGFDQRGSGNCTDDADDVVLAAGRTPPDRNADAITATRVASLDGQDVTVSVELW